MERYRSQLLQCKMGGGRHEYGLGIRQVKFNALHYFGKSEVTRSIISDDVYQQRMTSRSIGIRLAN